MSNQYYERPKVSDDVLNELRKYPRRKFPMADSFRQEIIKGVKKSEERIHLVIVKSKVCGQIPDEGLFALNERIFYEHFNDLGRKKFELANEDLENSSIRVTDMTRFHDKGYWFRENDNILFAVMLDKQSFMYCRFHVDSIGSVISLTITEAKKMELFSTKLDASAINVKGLLERRFVKQFNAIHNK